MFDGRNYQHAFEEACDDLSDEKLDRDDVRSHLISLEWTLWEAIRGVMAVMALIAGSLIIIPWLYLMSDGTEGWVPAVLFFVVWFGTVCVLYGVFRFVFYFEIARHVRGRKFGEFKLRP